MATKAQNGRECLLSDLLPEKDDHLWEKITRDLFEQKDRYHLWRLEIHERFAELTKDELDKKCLGWTKDGTKWLKEIAFDIYFATRLFGTDKWDPHILQDFIYLLALTLQLFSGKEKCMGMVKEHFKNSKAFDRSEDIVKKFDKWRRHANNSFREMVESVGYHKRKNWDKHNRRLDLEEGDKLSGATLTELLIRNQIQRQRSRIMSRPAKSTQQDTKHVNRAKLIDATEFENVYREAKKEFEGENKVRVDDPRFWHFHVIAVVADLDTGIIVTGASKPKAPKIPIFQDAADNISHMRVGEGFGSIIDKCSENEWKLFNGIRNKLNRVPLTDSDDYPVTKESAGLYDAVVNTKKDHIASYQNIPSSENGIISWAFGSDFQFKRPCTRCQSLYSRWILHKMPDTPGKKLAGLKQDHWSGVLKYSSGFKYPCGYCAETVAAAKFYALSNSVLTLVLPQDTDKIKASDRAR
ncbi:MAG: hypothetical protein Q9190_004689 [Brigantiaea leucoxantha]